MIQAGEMFGDGHPVVLPPPQEREAHRQAKRRQQKKLLREEQVELLPAPRAFASHPECFFLTCFWHRRIHTKSMLTHNRLASSVVDDTDRCRNSNNLQLQLNFAHLPLGLSEAFGRAR